MFKIGVSYNIFDSLELLQYSIAQIRNHVDFIIVTYQEKDYYGNNHLSDKDYRILIDLKEQNLINDLFCFKIDNYAKDVSQAKELEKQKRNFGRNICYDNECTHFMDMDIDEFYTTEQFISAKEIILTGKYKYTFCNFVNYYKKPIFKAKKISNSFVPFICELNPNKKLGSCNLSISIDPTRGYIINKEDSFYYFTNKELLMHHYSFFRKDLERKLLSSSLSNINRDKLKNIIQNINNIDENNLYFEYYGINKTYRIELELTNNQFNLPLKLD